MHAAHSILIIRLTITMFRWFNWYQL